jgi:hypothetical protein
MKNLKKFKESVNDEWSIEKFKNLYNTLDYMKDLIINFLTNSRKMKFKQESHNYNIETFIYDDDGELLYIEFKHCSSGIDDGYSYEFTDEELYELISYMNNPDLYLKSKKYNL